MRIRWLLKCTAVIFIAGSINVSLIVLARDMSLERSFEAHGVMPEHVVHVQYPNGVSVNEGNVLTPTQVKDKPSVKWDANPNQFYTLVMTDLDVPSRTDPQKKQFHHWLVGNIPGDNVNAGDELYEYITSGPSPGSGLHRYVFLVYQQPSKLIFDRAMLNEKSLVSRGTFSIAEFVEQNDLGDPVAGNFYQAEYDDYVPDLYKELKQKYNL